MAGERTLSKAVVIEYISNPARFKRENTDGLYDQLQDPAEEVSVSNMKYVSRAPRGSVVAIVVSEGKSQTKSKAQIFYPFFSHISMPLKVGEKVWVVFETAGQETSLGYWLSRCVSDGQIDDPNYTHDDRNSLALNGSEQGTSSAFESASTGESKINTLSFPDGSGGQGSTTLPTNTDYSTLIESSVSDYETTQEAVPRYNALSSELSLEGSNNARIVLGEYRHFGVPNDPSKTGVGAIDIVVGAGVDGTETAPAAIAENDRGLMEVDKNPTVTGNASEDNEDEGEPSFQNDLSRILLSMNSSSDADFGLEFTNESAPQVSETPYIVAKSTEVRLIGRDGGSVRLVKEGDTQAEICLMSDGTIAIEGTTSDSDATRTTQATMRGEDLADAFDDFSTAIDLALAEGSGTTKGNMGGALVDGDGESTGIRAAVKALADAARKALSDEVYIK